MYERLMITCGVAVTAWAASSLLRRRQVALADRASPRVHQGSTTPAIVYFWSDGCSVCKRTQRPILDRIVAEYGSERVAFLAYCVDEAPEVAGAWGVRTLPTTFVLDPPGNVRHVNNGLVVAERLRAQLQPLLSG